MAADTDLRLDADEASGKKKKLVLIIVGVALALIAAGIVTAWYLLDAPQQDEAAKAEAAPAVMPVQYVMLKPEFVVSYQVGQRQRFLQVSIEVMTRQQAVLDALRYHDPMVRNEIVRMLGEQRFEELRTAEGRAALQKNLLQHLSYVIRRETGADGIEAVLFTNFVMQ